MKLKVNAVTLLELILAIAFLSVIILGINSINYFSNFQTVDTERRAWLQNQVSVAAEHMRREISKAIGNEVMFGLNTVIDTSAIAGDLAIKVYIDSGPIDANGIYTAGNGRRDGGPPDRVIAYRRSGAAGLPGVPNSQYQLNFCPNCSNGPCTVCSPAWGTVQNTVAANIANFSVEHLVGGAFVAGKPINAASQLNDNSIGVQITACRDPSIPGNPNNLCISTDTLIAMPFVTAH